MIYILQRNHTENKMNSVVEQELLEGISVIIPTYKREHLIKDCLTTLKNQTLCEEMFEVLIIMNGQKDNTEQIVRQFIAETKMNNIKLLRVNKGSASLARNDGIKKAGRKYCLFLDDDDYLSPNYLEKMLHYSEENTVVVSQIVNVDIDGNENFNTTINLQIKHFSNKSNVEYTQIDKVATINACKLIPTDAVKKIKYKPELKSGEDIVFFTELFLANAFNFKILPIKENVIYYRYISPDSISRQKMSFEFNVQQRLEVIKILDKLLGKTKEKNEKRFIKSKITAQFLFVNNYFLHHKHDKEKIMTLVEQSDLSFIPYQLNDGPITRLKYYTRKMLKKLFK